MGSPVFRSCHGRPRVSTPKQRRRSEGDPNGPTCELEEFEAFRGKLKDVRWKDLRVQAQERLLRGRGQDQRAVSRRWAYHQDAVRLDWSDKR
jgi:hypothetical protein